MQRHQWQSDSMRPNLGEVSWLDCGGRFNKSLERTFLEGRVLVNNLGYAP